MSFLQLGELKGGGKIDEMDDEMKTSPTTGKHSAPFTHEQFPWFYALIVII